eukprot:COSAG06_NODE_7702_length_2405_cov_60.313096_4_plen_34_part_01
MVLQAQITYRIRSHHSWERTSMGRRQTCSYSPRS